MPKNQKIHVWLPDVFGYKGGIQVYSTFFIQALERILPDSDRLIFLKNDVEETNNIRLNPQTKFKFTGRWKYSFLHTPIFSLQVFWSALWQRPDLIICGHINFSPLALRVFKLLKIPYWVIVHGIDAWDLEDISKINGLKSAPKIISVSGYTRDRIVSEQNISFEQISLLPNTFDASKLTIQPKPQYLLDRYHFQHDQPIILTVARLVSSDRYKGYDQIIRSLPEIRRHIPNIHYLLVGKGNDRDRIESIIDEVNVRDCVTLSGFVPDDELSDHYNLCDVFAMPSKGEGFGIVYLEALACGKPTIGGNQDGAIDALCGGDIGILVDPDSLCEIAQAIVNVGRKEYALAILYQPELLRKKVIETYGFEKFKEKLSAILHKSV